MDVTDDTTPREYIRQLRDEFRKALLANDGQVAFYQREEHLAHYEALGRVFDAMLDKDID